MAVLVDAAVVGKDYLDAALEVFHDGRQSSLDLVDEVEADPGAVWQAHLRMRFAIFSTRVRYFDSSHQTFDFNSNFSSQESLFITN